MCFDINKFDEMELLKDEIQIQVASGHDTTASGVGRIGMLNYVLYVPELKKNLLSVQQLEREGFSILFQNGQVLLKDSSGKFTPVGVSDGHLYYLNANQEERISTTVVECSFVLEYVSDLELWHKRMCIQL
jgi:hypothetical protein